MNVCACVCARTHSLPPPPPPPPSSVIRTFHQVTTGNAEEQRFLSYANRIRFFAKSRNVPEKLLNNILQHMAWRWRMTHMLDEADLTEGLSGGVQDSLGLFRAIGMVSRMPFFMGMDSECVRTVVLQLRVEHYIGNDFLAQEGDVCEGCYFLEVGSIAFLSKPAKQRLQRHLEDLRQELGENSDDEDGEGRDSETDAGRIAKEKRQGDLLGEEGLLREWRWPNTIQALTCCELQLLSREAFLEVLASFPHELDRCTRLADKIYPTHTADAQARARTAGALDGPSGYQVRHSDRAPPGASANGDAPPAGLDIADVQLRASERAGGFERASSQRGSHRRLDAVSHSHRASKSHVTADTLIQEQAFRKVNICACTLVRQTSARAASQYLSFIRVHFLCMNVQVFEEASAPMQVEVMNLRKQVVRALRL